MRVSDMIQMGKSYLMLGALVVVAAAVLYCIGYFLIYRKIFKGTKQPSKIRLVLGAVFVCYLVVVVGATLLGRPDAYEGMAQGLFSSYLNAWYSFNLMDWRNLILNICMFIPFGFLLPLAVVWFRCFWKTYLAGFLVTFLIEGIQFVLHIGVFEADDILNNLVGTMIGYGVAYFILCLSRRLQGRKLFILSMQLPLILSAVFFGAVFGIYHQQEFGNMLYEYNMHIKDMNVTSTIAFSEEKETANIYQLKKFSQEETLALANQIFETVGTKVNESRNDFYQNTAVYHSLDGNYSVWVYYRGLSYSYTDFSRFEDEAEPKLGCGREEIEDALAKFGIAVPEQAVFSEEENGYYQFTVDCYEDGDSLLDGVISCQYSENGRLDEITNNLKKYDKYRACELISEKEAYEKIQAGDLYSFTNLKGANIEVTDVQLKYLLDSKGFYRPVYSFSVKTDTDIGQIIISAIEE